MTFRVTYRTHGLPLGTSVQIRGMFGSRTNGYVIATTNVVVYRSKRGDEVPTFVPSGIWVRIKWDDGAIFEYDLNELERTP